MPCEILAVYRQRSDGDFDFVAAIHRDTLPHRLGRGAGSDRARGMADEIAGAVREEGDEPRVLEFDSIDRMPDVWSEK
jgi:hypothetical protein